MIIFTTPDLLQAVMSNVNVMDCTVMNLTSFFKTKDNVTALAAIIQKIIPQTNAVQVADGVWYNPINIVDYMNTVDFDIAFANTILNNNDLFINLMMIMINHYEGSNVILLIDHDEYRDTISEALIKFIQIRYGYNCLCIDDTDDLYMIHTAKDKFTPAGIMNFDADRNRYLELFISNPSLGIGYIPADLYD